MRSQFAMFLACTTLFGCSAQHSTAYQGEPLAVLHGTVETQASAQFPPLEVALVSSVPAGDTMLDGGIRQRAELVITPVPVNGQFPSAFTLDLTTPPSEDTLRACGEWGYGFDGTPQPGRFLFADIQALKQGADASDYFGNVYGWATERVVYLDRDVTGCDVLAGDVRVGMTRGYHLVRRIPGPLPPTAADASPFFRPYFSEVPITTSIDLPVHSDIFPHYFHFQPGSQDVTAGPNCIAPAIPSDPSTGSPCQLFLIARHDLESGGSPFDCSVPGLSPATDADVDRLLDWTPQYDSICTVAQVPPSAWGGDTCAQSTQAGWCYASGAAAASCANGAVFFSPSTTLPPQGSTPHEWQVLCP